jgi:UDP-N-acetylglucosamine 2-epimerase
MNRVLADHASDLLFAPTQRARANLLREGIAEAAIRVTGNTGIDALLSIVEAQACRDGPPRPDLLPPTTGRIILVTAHRRENFGPPLASICAALRRVAQDRGDSVRIVYPVHRNPQVWGPVHDLLDGLTNVTLLAPVDYADFVRLMSRSYLILTDSGGLQEEAPSLGKPVLVLRATTERPEAVEAGTARLVGTSTLDIVRETDRLLDEPAAYAAMAQRANPFGDGHAAERIVSALLDG